MAEDEQSPRYHQHRLYRGYDQAHCAAREKALAADDAGTLRAAAAILRRRSPRQTFLLQVVTRVLELRADRISHG